MLRMMVDTTAEDTLARPRPSLYLIDVDTGQVTYLMPCPSTYPHMSAVSIRSISHLNWSRSSRRRATDEAIPHRRAWSHW
jgi:hypothetical protein